MRRKRIAHIALLLLAVILAGTFGYAVLMDWSWFDALYMTVITLATVGYGETHPLDVRGRVFTIFLIIGGMGILLYGVTEITAFLVEGEMSGIIRRRRMSRIVSKYSGHYILCGMGRTGRYILEELVRTGRQCVVIESDESTVKKLLDSGISVIDGDASDEETLMSAGIERAAGIVAALPDDKQNLFIVITARSMNPQLRIVSRIEQASVRDKFIKSGADATVSSSFIGGLRLASELVRPETVGFLDLMLRDGANLRVEDVPVGDSSRYVGERLEACAFFKKTGALLLALKSGENLQFNPPGTIALGSGDTLMVMGSPSQIAEVKNAVNS